MFKVDLSEMVERSSGTVILGKAQRMTSNTENQSRVSIGAVLAVLAVIAIAAATRSWGLGERPMWLDETLTIWYARQALADLWGSILGLEPHPPLYNTLQHFWLAFGVLTVPLVFLLGSTVAGNRTGFAVGLLAALIFAIAPLQVQFGQEARAYAALAAANTLLLCGAAWLVRHPSAMSVSPWTALSGGGGWPPPLAWAAVVAGSVLSLWFHNTAAFYVAILFLFALVWLTVDGLWRREVVINLLVVFVVILLLWAPYLPWLWQHTREVGREFWIAAPGSADLVHTARELFGAVYLWRFGPPAEALFAALAAWGAWSLARTRGWPIAALLLCAVILPAVVHLLASIAFKPIFLTRPLISSAVPFYVLVAAGVMALPWKVIRIAMFATVLVLQARALTNFTQTFTKEPWNRAVDAVLAEAGPDDVVYVYPQFAAVPFQHHLGAATTSVEVRPLPVPFPQGGIRALPLDKAARARLSAERKEWPRAWLVMRLTPHLKVREDVELAVRQDRRTALDKKFKQIRVWRYE